MSTTTAPIQARLDQLRAAADAERFEEQRAREKATRIEAARARSSESNPEREALARESARVIHERRVEAAKRTADEWVRQVGVPSHKLTTKQAEGVQGAVRRVLTETTSTMLFSAPREAVRTMNTLAAYDLIAGLRCSPSQIRMRSVRELVSIAQAGFKRRDEEHALIEDGGAVVIDLGGVPTLDHRDREALLETLSLLIAAASRRQIVLILGVDANLAGLSQMLGEDGFKAVLDAAPAVVDGMSR